MRSIFNRGLAGFYTPAGYDRPSVAAEMNTENDPPREEGGRLLRRFGLVQATALNMSNMIGVGPFITIPLLMSALGGPQAMVGWSPPS